MSSIIFLCDLMVFFYFFYDIIFMYNNMEQVSSKFKFNLFATCQTDYYNDVYIHMHGYT